MNTYVKINGKEYNADASLQDVRQLVKRFNLKLIKAYTFKMRLHWRRVLSFEAQGVIYSVYSPQRAIATNAWTSECVYFGFDKAKAYQLVGKGSVHEVNAREIDVSQPHLKSLGL